MDGRQLNLRLPPRDRDVLEALAFLRRTPASALAREIVVEYLSRSGSVPGLPEALEALRLHDAEETSHVVRELPKREPRRPRGKRG
jgi:hypothetical protein